MPFDAMQMPSETFTVYATGKDGEPFILSGEAVITSEADLAGMIWETDALHDEVASIYVVRTDFELAIPRFTEDFTEQARSIWFRAYCENWQDASSPMPPAFVCDLDEFMAAMGMDFTGHDPRSIAAE